MKTELIRFIVAGGTCFVFELAILYGLTEYAAINYLWSAAIAFTLSVILNYIMCLKWVFDAAKSNRPRGTKAFLFAATSVAGLGINQLSMWLLVELGGLYYMVAKIIAAIVVTAWNFFTKRLVLTR